MIAVFDTMLSARLLDKKIRKCKNVAALALLCTRSWRISQKEKPAAAAD